MPRSFVLVLSFCAAASLQAQDRWPIILEPGDGRTVTIYQPQPESYADGRFSARAAVSGAQKGKDPIFGAIWMQGFLEVDRDTRMGTVTELKITDMRFPDMTDTSRVRQWKDYLSAEIPKHTQPISIDRLIASLEGEEQKAPPDLKMDAPEVIYANTPSLLVFIDGEPRFQPMEKDVYERVVNTPFFIARIKDKQTFYLGTSQVWYSAKAIEGPWETTKDVPKQLQEIAPKDTSATPLEKDANGNVIAPKIIVRTKPAELVQTKGLADLKPIQGTQLLFVTNSDEDIFMDIASQQYFIVVSGRWYLAPNLEKGPWTYVPGDRLPDDFAKIPEDSEKGGVLASVPGTQAAKEAVLDAQIPQTAKVDRNSTTKTITYDGDPKWKLIEGTAIYEAENASTTVLYIRERYYACESAVWYESDVATGPWKVCAEVPKEVQDIPPSSPSYNVKYVYVYDSTPEVVYVGYTPGYTGCYVYGPTVVYGTGYYYYPWYGAMYYPRPVTYGFSMHYNPYTGWGMGFHFSTGCFSMSFYGGGYGGYWGPPMYRPPYYGHHGGYRGGSYRGGGNTINIDNSNNFYGDRGGGGRRDGVKPSQPIAKPGQGGGAGGNRPSTQPSKPGQGGAGNRPSTQPSKPGNNNVLTDKQGNVYRDNGKGGFQQQGANGKWQDAKPAKPSTGAVGTQPAKPSTQPSTGGPRRDQTMSPSTNQQLNRDMQNRQRGQQNANNYQQRSGGYSGGRGGGGYGGGGGGRMSGGGGRGGGGRR
ncbi:MAG TPA: hypothetical protein PLB89_16975 [Flavobacteriales bacterium]|nr:hypothetical protein [Flavobacteriales bacterium]